MDIDSTVSWPATPEEVLTLFTDEGFLRDRGVALGAGVQDVTVDGTETSVRLTAPTAGIPAAFARFVGNSVSFVERTAWVPDGEGGQRADLDARAEVFGRAVQVVGERRLFPDATGTRSTVRADVTVDAPVIGARAASAVQELVTVVLRREDELVRRTLAAS